MTILVTVWLTCFGLLGVGVLAILIEPTKPSQPTYSSIFSKAVMWLAVITMVVTFISILTIGFYTGDIKDWLLP